MGLKVFGIGKFGLALACSIGVHIVALLFFAFIGGDRKPEAAEAPAAPAAETPAAAEEPAPAAEPDEKKETAKPPPRAARPPKSRKPDAKTVKPKSPEPKTAAPKKPETKKPEEAAPQPAAADAGEWKEYEVQSGEGLWTIAKKFGIKAADLAKANGLKPTEDLKRGQKIKVPARDSAAD